MTLKFRVAILFMLPGLMLAQNRIGTGVVSDLYKMMCASCHGQNLDGGMGPSLIGAGGWKFRDADVSFLEYMKKGNISMGMPPFGGALEDAQIRSLEIFIQEIRQQRERETAPPVKLKGGVYSAGGYRFKLETVVDGLSQPWSLAFLPEGGALITERGGALRVFQDGVLKESVEGTPVVWANGQGGMLEVAIHPEYSRNGWIYLAFAASGGEVNGKKVGMTKVVRGRMVENKWSDEEVIFEVPLEFQSPSGVHFGTRFVFSAGYLYFGVGDRGSMEQAQDLSTPNGKIHRIHDDGRVPQDNPFVEQAGAYPTIWTYGNRNPQGLDLHPLTGAIWASEHGPRGGDEINLITVGKNYGWPEISHGMNYSGQPLTALTHKAGMEQPKHYWTPSIAVCGIDFYEGDVFPEWKYDLFVGGLASQELHRLEIEGGEIVRDEIILSGAGRIRDVVSGPEGHLYLVLNGPDRVARLTPVD